MTAQASDQVIYRDQGFMLCAFSNSEPFNPSAHGYRPVMASTACYRGYVCEYEVKNSSLQLRKLSITHQEGDLPVSALRPPRRLNGVEAMPQEGALSFIGRWVFNGVGLSIPYTGGLVLARGFIRSLYVHMGFHPAWKYAQVHELLFEDGVLVEEADVSLEMSRIRERLSVELKPTSDATQKEIESWISATFRRDYNRKSSNPGSLH